MEREYRTRLNPGLRVLKFIGFIILVLAYGQSVGSKAIINLGFLAFILEIISRYIGFMMQFSGYLMFSILAILGGIILIAGALLIPKWRRKIMKEAKEPETHSEHHHGGHHEEGYP